jgi:hypothetical protein
VAASLPKGNSSVGGLIVLEDYLAYTVANRATDATLRAISRIFRDTTL